MCQPAGMSAPHRPPRPGMKKPPLPGWRSRFQRNPRPVSGQPRRQSLRHTIWPVTTVPSGAHHVGCVLTLAKPPCRRAGDQDLLGHQLRHDLAVADKQGLDHHHVGGVNLAVRRGPWPSDMWWCGRSGRSGAAAADPRPAPATGATVAGVTGPGWPSARQCCPHSPSPPENRPGTTGR